MSVLSVQNMQETFVGAVGKARTGSVQVTNPNGANYITDGEIVVVNASGVVVDASTATTFNTTPFIQIVERNGDVLTWSSKIPYNGVISYTGATAGQGQEQVYAIGYNGVTATTSLDITSGLDFQLTLIENQDDMMWSEQKKKNVVYVPSNLVTTQLSLASAIVKNQMKKYITDGSSITAVMLNNGTASAVDGSARTLNVVHGSNLIVYSGATANIPGAGTVVRIGIAAGGRGTAVPVYTITGAGPLSNSFYIDQPYAGPSNTALPDVDHGVISAPGTNWGVRFVGKALPFRRDFFKFKRVSFTVQMSGFGTTVLTKTQEATYGNGDGRLVLEEESFSKGFEGALNRMTVPLPLANETFQASAATSTAPLAPGAVNYGDVVVTSTNLYNSITIAYKSNNRQTVVASPDMVQVIKIFGTVGSGQNSTGNLAIEDALNAFMGQARVGSFAAISTFV